MTLHEADLTELIELARRRGSVSMEDVRRMLPLVSMTLEELSLVVIRLEEAGFDLEVDPDLLLPGNDTGRKDALSDTKREQIELPETLPEERRQPASFPATVEPPILKRKSIRRSASIYSAPMFPWIVAFAIVLLAVFAFAFWIR